MVEVPRNLPLDAPYSELRVSHGLIQKSITTKCEALRESESQNPIRVMLRAEDSALYPAGLIG
jgi:hypothetical protein